MGPALIAGLVKNLAPDHAEHRAQEFVSFENGKVTIHCSCNVDLTLVVPESPRPKKTAVGDGA